MRADEYLVDEVKRLRKEIEDLTNKLSEKEQELLKSKDENDENEVVFSESAKQGEIFVIDTIQSYKIKELLKKHNITVDELNKALNDDAFCLDYHSDNPYDTNLLSIWIVEYNHVIKNKYGNVYLKVKLHYRNKMPEVSTYVIDNQNYFLDYDKAKEYGLKQLRENIKTALNEYNKELEDATVCDSKKE